MLDGIHTVDGAMRVTNGHFLVQRYNVKQMDGMIRPLKPLNKAPRESFENVDLNQSDLNKCKDLKGREYEICDASAYPDTYHLDRQMEKDKRRRSREKNENKQNWGGNVMDNLQQLIALREQLKQNNRALS